MQRSAVNDSLIAPIAARSKCSALEIKNKTFIFVEVVVLHASRCETRNLKAADNVQLAASFARCFLASASCLY